MDIALIVVALLALGLGAAVFVLMKQLSASRVATTKIEGELASISADRDRLGSELTAARTALEEQESERDRQSESVRAMSVTNAQLTERLDAAAKLIEEFKANREQMVQQFEALGSQTLKSNQEALGKFITERLKDADSLSQAELDKRKQAIESMVKPIRETLDKTHQQITQLDERVKASSDSNESLKEETARLTRALSRPEIRGRYGEIQLRRVAELAGMTDYCDFNEQFSERDGDGNLLRPDMVVTLPNDRVIVVDAKANINAYIEAVNAADDSERERHMERFSKHTSEQVKKLADKKYWALFERSPEFVVMFVPGDHFIDAALSRNPQLLDMAAQHGVILASPSTLIGLLRAVQVGWREQALSEQAAALFELGKELHDRAATAFEHAGKLGDSLRQSLDRYNKMVGSIDTRMIPTLRRFEEAGAKSTKSLTEPKAISGEPRQLSAGKGELFEG
jgi:DNA recombination protein RmuC